MRGSRGGVGGGPDPPWNFAKLHIADITGNEKLVIFHICALPHLYVKQNQSTKNNQITSIQVCVMGFFLLKVGPPPLEKISGSAPGYVYNFLLFVVLLTMHYMGKNLIGIFYATYSYTTTIC